MTAAASDLTPPPENPRVDWRGRWLVLLRFTLVACVANALALQLPGATPFLVGNMAAVAITLRFGLAWGVPVALLATVVTANPYWVGLALLECVRVSRAATADRPLLAAWWWTWWPLLPLVAWITLPAGADDPLLWLAGAGVVLLNGAVSLMGGRQLVRVTLSSRRMAEQPLASQLTVQLATLMATPVVLALTLLLQWTHQQDLRGVAQQLQAAAARLEGAVGAELVAHREALAQAALLWPKAGDADTLSAVATASPRFLSLLSADPRGDIRLAFRRGEGLVSGASNVADRAYFRLARDRGAPIVSPVFRGRGLGRDVIVAVATPLRAPDGTAAGVLQGALNPGPMAAGLRLELERAGMDYAVVDDAGQVVFSSLPEYPPLASADAVGALAPGGNARPWWARALLDAPPMAFDARNRYLHVEATSTSLGWTVIALQPLRPLERLQTARALVAAVLVLLLMRAIQGLSSRFARRHARGLSAVVERLRRFDPSSSADSGLRQLVGTSAELTELIEDFDRAETRLRDLHDALRESVEAQARLNRELETRVARRTVELREALERAERLAEAKTTFLANMSHELRTPLAAILGYAERALPASTPEADRRAALATVVRNGRHLLQIVNDVLDASKLDAGQLRVELQAVAPLPPVAEAVDLLASRAVEKRLALDLVPRAPLPARVAVDALRLKQIVLNLVGNAIKFTTDGGVRVLVEGDPVARRWSVVVEDTGIGMDEAQRERLFQRFEQADLSTTRRFGGTGLGLHISRELARQMGGDIEVDSTPGVGSRFRAFFPVAADAEWVEQVEAPRAALEIEALVPPALGGRVLVADDVPDLRALVRTMVEATGASVVDAAHGLEACERVRGGGIDLVLLDMHMPVMDGAEAVSTLRREGFGLPVVALSADVIPAEVARFLALGCTDALAKPIDTAALYALLARHLPAAAEGVTVPAAAQDPMAAAMAAVRARFLAGVPRERDALAAAAAARDRPVLEAQAHRLKGSAGTFGFMAVSRAAAALEQALRAEATSGWPEGAIAALDAALAEAG